MYDSSKHNQLVENNFNSKNCPVYICQKPEINVTVNRKGYENWLHAISNV